MMLKSLAALPVYNEARHVNGVLDQVSRFADDVLVVDDGSIDETAQILEARSDIQLVKHPVNRGYGAALMTAFEYAEEYGYDVVVTLDCDGQHEPCRIPKFVEACSEDGVDIVSGSRYLKHFEGDSRPPEQRFKVNRKITATLNERLGFHLTDAFCGFKAYRVASVARMNITELGYAMPLEVWVQAACLNLKVIELPVPLIYLDERRSFGGSLDDATTRLAYYREVLDRSFDALPAPCHDRLLEEYAG